MYKYTLCITQKCNLRCTYCYINKRNISMSFPTARKIIEFIFATTPLEEKIDIGFFGGEPLLEFELLKTITRIILDHPSYDKERVVISITSNGTIFTSEIADFFNLHNIGLCVSCDGPPHVQNMFRKTSNGINSSDVVEYNIRQALKALPIVLVNAVYHPATFEFLPETVPYLSSLGLKRIYLNPDFSASWSKQDVDKIVAVYGQVGKLYENFYLQKTPHYISFIDSKIAIILRGGYHERETCQMGKKELAFSPEGYIFLCERLIKDGNINEHCIGHVDTGFNNELRLCNSYRSVNNECLNCSLRHFCMNWCGCSNYFSSGHYNRVSPFLCASEKATIQTAFNVFQNLEAKLGPIFLEHFSGSPAVNSSY